MISLRRVEPSSMNASAPCCDDSDDTEKSSNVPNCFRMFASVCVLVVPFNDTVSPITGSNTSKLRSVFASSVSCPFRRLVYFLAVLSTVNVRSPICISTFPRQYSLFWLITLRFLRSFFEVELKRVQSTPSTIELLPE